MLESWLNYFQNTNFFRIMFKLKKNCFRWCWLVRKEMLQLFCDCWNMCCQSNSNFWSRQLFQTVVLACRIKRCRLVVYRSFSECHFLSKRCVCVRIHAKWEAAICWDNVTVISKVVRQSSYPKLSVNRHIQSCPSIGCTCHWEFFESLARVCCP